MSWVARFRPKNYIDDVHIKYEVQFAPLHQIFDELRLSIRLLYLIGSAENKP